MLLLESTSRSAGARSVVGGQRFYKHLAAPRPTRNSTTAPKFYGAALHSKRTKTFSEKEDPAILLHTEHRGYTEKGNNILDESSSSQDNTSASEGGDESDGDDYDAWEHMVGDALDEKGYIALVVPYTAYLDASYNWPKGNAAHDPRILTMAAYIAHQDDWRRMRREWRKVLNRFGNVPYFHMNEFEYAKSVAIHGTGRLSSKSPYRGWQPEKFDEFFNALAQVINRKRRDGAPRIAARMSCIMIDDYESTLPDDLRNHPACRSAFILNTTNLMGVIARWADKVKLYNPIHYIFAGGDDDAGYLDPLFNRFFKREETTRWLRLAKGFGRMGYDIQWMKAEPALQMADCPAYEWNRAVVEWAKRGFSPTLKREFRASLSILCRVDHVGQTLRKELELPKLYDDIRKMDARLGL